MNSVAIIGAGITGLTAAFRLQQENIPVTIYEEALADFVRRRLGQEFLEYAINPFVGGIYAGANAAHGEQGIHWHINASNKVEYLPGDPQRQTIPWVRFTDGSGESTEYRASDFKGEVNPKDIRVMDCVDCHNRPGLNFQPR